MTPALAAWLWLRAAILHELQAEPRLKPYATYAHAALFDSKKAP